MLAVLVVLAAPAVKKSTKKKVFATKYELLSYFVNMKNMIHVLSSLFFLLLLQENKKLTTITYQMLQR
jgi:hypothetical protein